MAANPWPAFRNRSAIVTAAHCSLLENAAKNALWRFDLPTLKRISLQAYPQLELPPTHTDAVRVLIMHSLGVDGSTAVDCMELRCGMAADITESDRSDLLASAAASDAMDATTLVETQHHLRRVEVEKDEDRAMVASVQAMRRSLKPSMKRKAVHSIAPMDDRYSVESVSRVLPPGFKLWQDDFCARYQVLYKGNRASRSRSWGVRSRRDALLELVRWSWQLHCDLTGEPCPYAALGVNASA